MLFPYGGGHIRLFVYLFISLHFYFFTFLCFLALLINCMAVYLRVQLLFLDSNKSAFILVRLTLMSIYFFRFFSL